MHRPTAETAKEAAPVQEQRTFSEAEHFALLTDAVTRETATITEERDGLAGKLAASQQRIDVLEAEKAAAVAERDQVRTEFDAYKAEIEEKARIAERKEARIARVKAANNALPEGYFTDERTQRWAEMADADFDVVVGSLEAAKPARGTGTSERETAAFTGGTSPSAGEGQPSTARRFLGLRHGAPAES